MKSKHIIVALLALLALLDLLVIGVLLISWSGDVTTANLMKLETDTGYKFDLDGDGKRDRLSIHKEGISGRAHFLINGEDYEVFIARGMNAYLYRVSQEDTFLINNYGQFGGSTILVYRYTGHSLEEVCNCNVLNRNLILSAEGEYFYVDTSPYHYGPAFNITSSDSVHGTISFKAAYHVDTETHTVSRESLFSDAIHQYNLTYTGTELFRTSSSYEEINEEGELVLEPGMAVSITKAYSKPKTDVEYVGYDHFFQLSDGIHTGWIKYGQKDPVSFTFSSIE